MSSDSRLADSTMVSAYVSVSDCSVKIDNTWFCMVASSQGILICFSQFAFAYPSLSLYLSIPSILYGMLLLVCISVVNKVHIWFCCRDQQVVCFLHQMMGQMREVVILR